MILLCGARTQTLSDALLFLIIALLDRFDIVAGSAVGSVGRERVAGGVGVGVGAGAGGAILKRKC